MKVVTIREEAETCPKLPIEDQQEVSTKSKTMKFNWKANWEILLVLVIIIVGIVITTIAAIRSKDKQLLVLPDDAGEYSGSVVGDHLADHVSSLQVPPLPQTDFQLTQHAQASNVGDDGGEGPTSSPFAGTSMSTTASASPKRPPKSNLPSSVPQSAGQHAVYTSSRNEFPTTNRKLQNTRQASGRVTATGRGRQQDEVNDYGQTATRSASAVNVNQMLQPLDYDNPTQHATIAGQLNSLLSSTESYDTSSTEPTPSLRLNGTKQSSSNNTRRNVPSRQLPTRIDLSDGELTSTTKSDGPEPGSGESVDDIHTTRSSLAQSNYGRLDNNGQPILALHGPYELSPTTNQNQIEQLGNRLTHQRLLQHASNSTSNKQEVTLPPLDAEEMMTSYSRQPQNNLTNAMLRDYNLASATYQTGKTNASASSVDEDQLQQQQQNYNSTNLARLRAHSASLPFMMLLNDMIRLTRPDQSSLTNSQGGEIEQPANSRPQFSILQQLRNLPAPLLALLQASSPISSSASTGGLNSALNEQLGGVSNHDASESNQHYQRISMSPTDMSVILSRSLRATGILPAFPPPKGTPQTWIPPTAGGTPVSDPVGNNADFVAGNTAGFLRASGLADAGSSSANADPGASINPSNQQQQPQQQSTDSQMYNQPQTLLPDQQQQQNSQLQQNEINNHPLVDSIQAARQQQMPQMNMQQNGPPVQARLIQGDAQMQQQQTNYRPLRHNFAQNQLQQQQQLSQAGNFMSNLQQQQQQPMMLQNQLRNGNMLQSSPAQMLQPGYNSRQTTSEIIESSPQSVPLGFNPNNQQQQQNMVGPTLQQQQQQQYINQNNYQPQQVDSQRHSNANFNNFNILHAESSPTAIVTSSSGQQQSISQRRVTDLSQLSPTNGPQNQPIQLNTINRSKRSTTNHMEADDDFEEYLDSRPMSIVSPDGRPMNNDEVKILRTRPYSKSHDVVPQATGSRSSTTQRLMKNTDLNESALHHYVSENPESTKSFDGGRRKSGTNEFKRHKGASSSKQEVEVEAPVEEFSTKSSNQTPFVKKTNKSKKTKRLEDKKSSNGALGRDASLSVKSIDDDRELINGSVGNRERLRKKKKNNNLGLDTASSGLMSKLLGTASTTDELEEDLDGDDDAESANERRKEELDDAEFGIVNDDARNSGPRSDGNDGGTNSDSGGGGGGSGGPPLGQQNDEVSRLTQDSGSNSNNGNDEANLGSGSMDSSAYTRRNQPTPQQQRADVEFYGHPGEETRQLKYGILGSGNYEVVNGGIYPDVDESTAAVNSVANYVRKPGGVLLSGLPKLLAAAAGGASTEAGFMPGSRMSAVSGGYMRGASANPDELVGMYPDPHGPSGGVKLGLHSPLMELIDANNGHLFDPNLVAHLGSSGTSARTTYSSQDGDNDEKNSSGKSMRNRENDQVLPNVQVSSSHKPKHRANSRNKQKMAQDKNNKHGQGDSIDHMVESERDSDMNVVDGADRVNESDDSYSATHQTHRHPLTGSKGQGTNQFYSYQILPSKKVTIFSDQDLDSAPSDADERRVILE